MISTIHGQTTDQMSTVDALWTLIQGQSKRVRQALTKRLLAEQQQARTNKRVEDITQTAGYKEAMDDIKHGRVYSYDSVDQLFEELGINVR